MRSQLLLKSREFEEKEEKNIAANQRPTVHLSPRIGWMNDPNGFSYYNGKYHLFYQYNPYDTNWGPMHWGHSISDDMINWEYLPTALAPDEKYDHLGCFSGSAIELQDGRQLLMYTGVAKENSGDMASGEVQTQCLAVGDGVNYEKWSGNPVLNQMNLPAGASKVDFRDPKIWQESDGTYHCVVANRMEDGNGQLLLFSSENGFDWNYNETLIRNTNSMGRMWECPDYFRLDGKSVIITSPQDMMAQELEYPNGNGTLCFIGMTDEERGFLEESNQSIDYGIDFYAPQTTLTPDGRRVMIGWMQNWDTCSVRIEDTKWYGQMSIPRELSIQNNKLIQRPVKEFDALRKNTILKKNIVFSGRKTFTDISGRVLDMEIDIEPENTGYEMFEVRFAENQKFHSSITIRPKESTVEIDRNYSGVRRAGLHNRKCRINNMNGKIQLRIILDRYSMEVFVNGGEQVMSMAIYTDQSADGISFISDGKVKVNLTKSDL